MGMDIINKWGHVSFQTDCVGKKNSDWHLEEIKQEVRVLGSESQLCS